jgi:hypothetical protein
MLTMCCVCVLCAVAVNPLDVICTRMYNQPAAPRVGLFPRGQTYTGPWDCFAKTLRAEGWSAFYKGGVAHYWRVGPRTCSTCLTSISLVSVSNSQSVFLLFRYGFDACVLGKTQSSFKPNLVISAF